MAEDRTVDLWFCRLAEFQDATFNEFYTQILSEDERKRAGRFRFQLHCRVFVYCRAALRMVLAHKLGYEAGSLRFALGPNGKPSLPGSGIVFNASHSREFLAIAVSTGAELGVDIEHVNPIEDVLSMARKFFAPEEAQKLKSLAVETQIRSFFECWTRKEAVIKATGEGISRPLDSFEVEFGPGSSPKLLRLGEDGNPRWGMESFDPAPEYLAALASSANWAGIRTYHIMNLGSASDLADAQPL